MKTKIIFALLLLSSSAGATQTVCLPSDGDCTQVVVAAIKQAKLSVDVAVFRFPERNVADALIVAASHGVKVRVITDEKEPTLRDSQIIHLQQASIPVLVRSHKNQKRNKFMVIDNNKVLVGNSRWTSVRTDADAIGAPSQLVKTSAAHFQGMFVVGPDE